MILVSLVVALIAQNASPPPPTWSCPERMRMNAGTCEHIEGKCDRVLDVECPPPPKKRRGTLSTMDVLLTVKANLPQIEECRRLHGGPAHFTVTWTIRPSGRTAQVVPPTGEPAALNSCVATKIARWRFPRASATTPVSFPFVFRAPAAEALGASKGPAEPARNE